MKEQLIEKSNIIDSPELTELDINKSSYLLCVKDNKLHKVGIDNVENKIFKQFSIECPKSTPETPYTEFECDYGKLVILHSTAGGEMALYFTYSPNPNTALIPLGNLDPDISSSEREKEKYVYTDKSTSGSKISDGWYFSPPQNTELGRYQYMSMETGMRIRPGGDSALYEYSSGVLDKNPIYLVEVYYYKDGMFQISKQVFWNGLSSSDPISRD